MARGVNGMWPGRRGLALADDLLDLLAHGLEGDVQGLEGLGGDALALVDEAEQDVLGADVVVVEHPRLFLGEDHDPSGSVGEAFEHVSVLRAVTRMSVPRGSADHVLPPRYLGRCTRYSVAAPIECEYTRAPR